MESTIELVIEVLDRLVVCGNHTAWYSIHYKACSHFCLIFPDIFLPEQELTVQIRDIDAIKINDVDIAETG
jgi:hypothetical protein